MDGQIDARRLVFPGLAGFYGALAPLSYPLARICVGVLLMPHGFEKLFHGEVTGTAGGLAKMGFPAPLAFAYFVGLLEFFGGAMLALGLLTRIVAIGVAIEMLIAIHGAHWPNGYFWTAKGYEYPLMWGVLCVAIAWRGGGRFSLDHLIGKEF